MIALKENSPGRSEREKVQQESIQQKQREKRRRERERIYGPADNLLMRLQEEEEKKALA